jgi:hypothetical protein
MFKDARTGGSRAGGLTIHIPAWLAILIPLSIVVMGVLAVRVVGADRPASTAAPGHQLKATVNIPPGAAQALSTFFGKPGTDWVVPRSPSARLSGGALSIELTNPNSRRVRAVVRFYYPGTSPKDCVRSIPARADASCTGAQGSWARIRADRAIYPGAHIVDLISTGGGESAFYWRQVPVHEVR